MRRVGRNSFTEIYFRGCNPSFIETTDGYVMIDSPQIPMDAMRWREMMENKAPIRYLINTEPHGDHIAGNAYFKGVTVVGQVKLQECFDRYLNQFGSLEEKRERMKQSPIPTASGWSAIPTISTATSRASPSPMR